MTTLSIHPEYCAQIRDGVKRFEYRSWPTDHRGPLLIASTTRPPHPGCPCSSAVVIVDVTDCQPHRGGFAWSLANPTPIPEPVRIRGQLNLYQFTHPVVEKALQAHLAKSKRHARL